MPYGQIKDDLDRGVIPRGPNVERCAVVDCGANIGLFALYFRTARRVVVIEPNPDCWGRLARNLSRNGIHGEILRKAD
jgi:hypothetical protein